MSGAIEPARSSTIHVAMPGDLNQILPIYADLVVKIGLNLKAGQRLLIVGPLASGGVSLEGARLVEAIAASAYRADLRSSRRSGATKRCNSSDSRMRHVTHLASFRTGFPRRLPGMSTR